MCFPSVETCITLSPTPRLCFQRVNRHRSQSLRPFVHHFPKIVEITKSDRAPRKQRSWPGTGGTGVREDLRSLLKLCFPAFAMHGSRCTDGTLKNWQPPTPDIPAQHSRLDESASHFTDGSALSPSCYRSRFQPSRPEAWTRGCRGMSRHYQDKRKYRKTDTAPFGYVHGL